MPIRAYTCSISLACGIAASFAWTSIRQSATHFGGDRQLEAQRQPLETIEQAQEGELPIPVADESPVSKIRLIAQSDAELASESDWVKLGAELRNLTLDELDAILKGHRIQNVRPLLAGYVGEQTDPDRLSEIAAYLDTRPERFLKQDAYQALASQWMRNDPDSASAWLDTLDPKDHLKMHALNAASRALAEVDPKLAFHWSQQQGANGYMAQVAAYRTWLQTDPESAFSAAKSSWDGVNGIEPATAIRIAQTFLPHLTLE